MLQQVPNSREVPNFVQFRRLIRRTTNCRQVSVRVRSRGKSRLVCLQFGKICKICYPFSSLWEISVVKQTWNEKTALQWEALLPGQGKIRLRLPYLSQLKRILITFMISKARSGNSVYRTLSLNFRIITFCGTSRCLERGSMVKSVKQNTRRPRESMR